MRAATWADAGYLPVRGGMLDQAASFVAALDYIRAERDTAQQQEIERKQTNR